MAWPRDRERFRSSFDAEVAERFAMEWKIRYWGERQRRGDARLAL